MDQATTKLIINNLTTIIQLLEQQTIQEVDLGTPYLVQSTCPPKIVPLKEDPQGFISQEEPVSNVAQRRAYVPPPPPRKKSPMTADEIAVVRNHPLAGQGTVPKQTTPREVFQIIKEGQLYTCVSCQKHAYKALTTLSNIDPATNQPRKAAEILSQLTPIDSWVQVPQTLFRDNRGFYFSCPYCGDQKGIEILSLEEKNNGTLA